MKYLESYQLFEAETRQAITDEIVNALENTPEGKDLLALATRENPYTGNDPYFTKSRLYTPRRTGRVEINNLRGRTYITQLPGGRWYHAVEATGTTYGEGVYDSLTQCIRGVWRDFIASSTSIIPGGMPRKMYKEFLDVELPQLMGKKMSKTQIREHLSKVYSGGNKMMDNTSPIFTSPRWIQIFNLIGLEKKYGNFNGGSYSTIREKRDKNSILKDLYKMLDPDASLIFFTTEIKIQFFEYTKKMSVSTKGNILEWPVISLGMNETPDVCKTVENIAAKKFISKQSSFHGVGIKRVIANFALQIFAKGMEGDSEIEINDPIFFEFIAPLIKEKNPSPFMLARIRKELPKFWEVYKVIDPSVESGFETLADLGDLGF